MSGSLCVALWDHSLCLRLLAGHPVQPLQAPTLKSRGWEVLVLAPASHPLLPSDDSSPLSLTSTTSCPQGLTNDRPPTQKRAASRLENALEMDPSRPGAVSSGGLRFVLGAQAGRPDSRLLPALLPRQGHPAQRLACLARPRHITRWKLHTQMAQTCQVEIPQAGHLLAEARKSQGQMRLERLPGPSASVVQKSGDLSQGLLQPCPCKVVEEIEMV